MNTQNSYHPTVQDERYRYVRLTRFLNMMDTEKRHSQLEQRQLGNLLNAVKLVVNQLTDIRCPPEMHFLAEVYVELCGCQHISTYMDHKLLRAIEGTKKMKQDIPICLARMHSEFWGITTRQKANFREKDIQVTNDIFL